MPVHDWSAVDAGIFHHFHHSWIEDIQKTLNAGLLPDEFYALSEQHAAGFGPDVLTLQSNQDPDDDRQEPSSRNGGSVLLQTPLHVTAETDLEYYRRKQNAIAIRHVSGDRIVAMVEVVSPGNKNSRHALRSFVEKAAELLEKRVHLLVLDIHQPGPRDPQGIHGAVWEEITDEPYSLPRDKPFTLASYETALTVRAYVAHAGLGDRLPDMPLFLEPGGHIRVPLEATYERAWEAFPRRWRAVVAKRAGDANP